MFGRFFPYQQPLRHGNLSLALNPLGFYQIAKILTTPTVVILHYFIAGTTVSKTVIGSLGAICIGAGLTCKGSTDTKLLGALVATAAFITTALYQIWIGTKQEGVNSAQLLFNQSYVSLGMLTIIIPFTDRQQLAASTIGTDGGEILDVRVWVAIALSGVMAMVVNLTQFLIIGKTSAVTFNVASHLKTTIILVAGWVLRAKGFIWIELLGILIAVAGAVVYSFDTQ
ncbi:TPT-domain-containing protein [Wilcoxina mikolae CBS 423.85]|nr:TPT-domain-containing protein [Wilcoxina mikolae CBS 423.85]